jgi:uncharacterized RDD family membrane protein YckC
MNELSTTTHAGVVTRVLAAGVDVVAVALLAVGLDLAAAGARFVWSPVDFRWPRPAIGSSIVVLLAIGVLYLTVAWAMTGRTYGGRLLGLRLLSTRGELLGWTRAFLRALTCVLWPVGLLWSGISTVRSSLQDILFRTVVVYDAHPYVHAHTADRQQGRADAAH